MGWQHTFLIIEHIALVMAVWAHWATSWLFDVAAISSMLHQSWNTKQWPSDDAPPPPQIQSDDDPPEHHESDDDSGPSESDGECSHSDCTFRGTNQYQCRMRCRMCGEVWTA